MEKKATRLANSKEDSLAQRKTEENAISDLIEMRRLQQEALRKIITSMENIVPMKDLSSSFVSLAKNRTKRSKNQNS